MFPFDARLGAEMAEIVEDDVEVEGDHVISRGIVVADGVELRQGQGEETCLSVEVAEIEEVEWVIVRRAFDASSSFVWD